MSTSYRPLDDISIDAFKDAVEELGLKIYHKDGVEEPGHFAITDGEQYMWCYHDGKQVHDFGRYGANYGASDFLDQIGEALGVEIISEHDDGYFEEEE